MTSTSAAWPRVEDLVSPELPPEVAVARLVALARSLMIENGELRDALALARAGTVPAFAEALHAHDGAEAA